MKTDKKILSLLFGIILITVGEGIIHLMKLGSDPFISFVEALSNIISFFDLRIMILIIEILLIIVAYIFDKKTIGIASIISLISFHLNSIILENIVVSEINYLLKIILLIIGIILVALGTEILVYLDKGLPPYEAIVYMFMHRMNKDFLYTKYEIDGLFIVLTIMLEGKAELGTLIIFMLMAPCMHYIGKLLHSK